MSVTKDGDTGRWMSQIRVTDWTGKTIHKKKRGFATKKEALQWERDFISQSTGSLGMTFGDFISLYVSHLRRHPASELLHGCDSSQPYRPDHIPHPQADDSRSADRRIRRTAQKLRNSGPRLRRCAAHRAIDIHSQHTAFGAAWTRAIQRPPAPAPCFPLH